MSIVGKILCLAFRSSDNKRDKGLTVPDTVERHDNIVYGAVPESQVLDVYRPKKEAGKKLPVIVSIHGGGWVYGDKELYQWYCMNMAERGFAVVNFTYRLAPKYKYPAQIEDTGLVFAWLYANAERYGFDTDHIFAVGDSAGAHNLGMYSAILTNPEIAREYPTVKTAGVKIRGVGLNCGTYETEKKSAMDKGLMSDLLPKKGTPEELAHMNVVRGVTENFPPAYVMTAYGDFLKESQQRLLDRMEEKGVLHEFHLYGSEENPLGHVFHLNIRSADAKACNDDEVRFFRSLM